ncbi:RNA helicase aquarius-like isoform X2 [Panicum virgatum]|uniref:RNA helicase aquarius-like isoform X2 n=1 Tax=Panicum virgatum TaxID=38727 RepID=UPI0019D53AA3|nr:RNA helicase aquarius-like isoform X2 [Panicum virgatum]
MPKVFGVGVFEFRHPRAAEYPLPADAAPATTAAPDKVPASTGGASITLLDIQRDRLTRVAAEHWSTPAAASAFDADLVREIYATELRVEGRGRKTVPLHRVMILEVSQYLENYLWPHFDPADASFEHVMSIILMVNEKFRENVAAWTCFHDRKDAFKGFLWRVLKLKEEERTLNMAEKTNYLLFMINAFQSLEDELLRETILQLVSLKLWNTLSFGRLQMELCLNPELIKKWTKIKRREAKEAKKADQPANPSEMLENKFLRNLIEEFLEILDSKVILSSQDGGEESVLNESLSGQVDDSCVLYCERFMEFLIDMLSQLPTRRFLRPLVADVAVVAKCHLSALYTHEKGRLFAQLVDLLQFYEGFEINDHSGTQLGDDDVLQAHYSRFQAFQLLAFKQVPKLRDFALSSIGSLHKRADLTKKLLVLSDMELQDLVCNKLKLISEKDPCSGRRDFLIEVLVAFFEKRQSQKDAVNALPLYPNEHIMWDESLVPSINYSGEGCLALPKLNLQFLTLHDYLLRNFNLFRLESTYEIREDIQEAVPHLHSYINNEGETAFRGWSRMAVPIKEFKITEVKQPNIGEVKPSTVTADVTFSISSYRHQIKSEWDALKEHDVLFLLSIRPSFEPLSPEEAAKSTVPERLGLQYVRGCEVIEIRDEEGTLMNDFTGRIKREEWKPPKGDIRTVRIALDTAQYHIDVTETAEKGAENVSGTFNILMRRKPKENNFKAILESIRDLMNETCVVPEWLHNIFLGYGNPSAAQWINMPDLLEVIDFKDTYLDANHVQQSFPDYQITFINSDGTENLHPSPPFKIRLSKKMRESSHALPGNVNSSLAVKSNNNMADGESQKEKLIVETYVPADPGPYPQDKPKQNSVRFTPTQIGAIISGVQPGLTMVVGPPGTGKTDTAVQILNVLYHNCPSQRTLIITHSNQALNDLFEKIMQRDVPARYLLRLGQGEQELATDLDFSRQGRVNAMLVRRLELLGEVSKLARSLRLPEDVGYTCETAAYFWLLHVYARWEQFLAACAQNQDNPSFVKDRFPFSEFFSDTPQPIFTGESFDKDMHAAKGCFKHLSTIFQELEECRAFELLKSTVERANYLMTKQAKIVAMTCTHAALKRRDFLQLGFKFDNLLMEESAQILEIETFIPMLLQRQEDGYARLKRCILIGDHHQLPPVVKNMAFQKYSHMDQSLFTRFVRLGVPYIELNAQGRARPSIAKLYNWRYRELGDLPYVHEQAIFHKANAGFSFEYQLVDVPDYKGKGESAPSPWFYQNEGEAEYIVSVYIYMRLIGYPANKISILTTYNGQKLLIRDVINKRCKPYNIEPPNKVTTVDKFQGQQNDFILLSLVRTRFVGHLRDVRRLIVAMSRARLGLYVFCRRSLFEQCYELQPTFQLLLQRPDKLALNLEECTPFTERPLGETGNIHYVTGIEDIGHLVKFRLEHLRQMQYMQYYAPPPNELPPAVPENIAAVIPSENGSVPNQPNEHMAVEENGGGASDTMVGNMMEEDAVEAKDETMQEGNKTGEGNGDGDGDVAAKDKDYEHADANDKMEEGDAMSKDKIEEE